VIKKFTIIGAVIGTTGGFALSAVMTMFAFLAAPSWPGGYELVVIFAIVCIQVATGAAIGSVAGLIVGIAVSTFSNNKE